MGTSTKTSFSKLTSDDLMNNTIIPNFSGFNPENFQTSLKNLLSTYMSTKDLLYEISEITNQLKDETNSTSIERFLPTSVESFMDEIRKTQIVNSSLEDTLLKVSTCLLQEICSGKNIFLEESYVTAKVIVSSIQKLNNNEIIRKFISDLCKGKSIPLDLLWLICSSLIDLKIYLTINCTFPDVITQFTKQLADAVKSKMIPNSIDVLQGLLSSLVIIKYCKIDSSDAPTELQNIKKVAGMILDTVTSRLLDAVMKNDSSCELVNIYELISNNILIDSTLLQKFFTQQLILILCFQPLLKVTVAFMEQINWSYGHIPVFLKTIYKQLILPFKPEQCIHLLKHVLEQEEVNWQLLLMYVSMIVTLFPDENLLINELINSMLIKAFQEQENECLISGFLLARQACFEGHHAFPSYSKWFQVCMKFDESFDNIHATVIVRKTSQKTFGDSSLASNKKSFSFLIKFLSDFVAYEPEMCLKAHILYPPAAPAKCRNILSDYVTLVKTRLSDLNISIENIGIFDKKNTEKDDSNNQNINQASSDVEKSLENYERIGKIPSTVMEASIFRKPYFISRFLPALLMPRKLPGANDTRMKFIADLLRAGKIPSIMYKEYEKACEKESEKNDKILKTTLPCQDLNKAFAEFRKLLVEGQHVENQSEMFEFGCENISNKLKPIFGGKSEDVEKKRIICINFSDLSLDQLDIEIADQFVNTFSQILTNNFNLESKTLRSWAVQFISLCRPYIVFQKAIYYRLLELFFFQNFSLEDYHIVGLGAFLVHIGNIQELLAPVEILMPNKINQQITYVHGNNFIELLWDILPAFTKQEMFFYVNLACSYLHYAFMSSSSFNTNSQEHHNIMYIPNNLLKKFDYLIPRIYPEARWKSGFNNKLHPFPLILYFSEHMAKLHFSKVTLEEWYLSEIFIDPNEDVLNAGERLDYMNWWILYTHCSPFTSSHDVLIEKVSNACSTVFRKLLLSYDELPVSKLFPDKSPLSRNSILQSIVKIAVQYGKEDECWLLNELKEIIDSCRSKWHLQDTLKEFFMLIQLNMPHLLFKTTHLQPVLEKTLEGYTAIINNVLINEISSGIALEHSISEIFWTGLLYAEEKAINSFLRACPILVASLIVHWKPLQYNLMLHATSTKNMILQTLFKNIDKCLSWCKSVENIPKDDFPNYLESWQIALILVNYLIEQHSSYEIKLLKHLDDKLKYHMAVFSIIFVTEGFILNIQSYMETAIEIVTNYINDYSVLHFELVKSNLPDHLLSKQMEILLPYACLRLLLTILEQNVDISPSVLNAVIYNYNSIWNYWNNQMLAEESNVSSEIINIEILRKLNFCLRKIISKTNSVMDISKDVLIMCPPDLKAAIQSQINYKK